MNKYDFNLMFLKEVNSWIERTLIFKRSAAKVYFWSYGVYKKVKKILNLTYGYFVKCYDSVCLI